MRVRWKQREDPEVDHELLWLGASLGGLACAVGWRALRLPWPSCVFHDLTGLPCLTCGATRAGVAFFHAQFAAAWNWNPLVFFILCGLTLYNVYAFAVLVLRIPRLRFQLSRYEKRIFRVSVVCLLALNWIYSLGHWRDF
jgi:hypothetical protein